MAPYWLRQVTVVVLGLSIASVAMADSTAQPVAQPITEDNAAASTDSGADLSGLSLEQLMNVQVQTPAGLTATDTRHLPVDVTQLDNKDIQLSGAYDLNSFLELYVPNEQMIDHNSPDMDIGFRGIISDTDDKYLYQVNGVTLNNRMIYGANDERDQPLMGDINRVDVVSGPASATYGSGALAGVIDVTPFTGLTYQGADVNVRQGIVNQYTATELRFGRKFSDDSGLFMYFGYAQVQGADAPMYFGNNYAAKNGLPANVVGQPFSGGPIANLNQSAYDAPFYRAYIDYVSGPFEVWTRFIQDGEDTRPARNIYTSTKPAGEPLDQWLQGREIKNQVGSTAVSYKKDLSDQWNLQLLQSYDIWMAKDQRAGVSQNEPQASNYENQLFSRAIATWTPESAESLAFGTEYSHEWYHDPPRSNALDAAPVVTTRDWNTDTISFLAEEQYKFNKEWTGFLSARTDKNTYTNWLLSPRATVVYTPTDKDTFKFIAGIAVRRQDDEYIWGQWFRTRTYAQPETLGTLEYAYEHKFTDEWSAGGNAFFEDYHPVGFDPSSQTASTLGHFQIAGGEVDVSYRTDATRVTFSEGISSLVYGSVPGGSPAASQGISSSPYGFGNQLESWAPSITKLAITQDISRQWSASGSVVYYSGFPGAQDYAHYAATLTSPPGGVPLSAPGYSKPYGPNMYLNLGLQYSPNEHWTFRVDGYNLMDLDDPFLSKRNYILRESEFSVQPASLGLEARYKF